ncbi:hypothetical protein [Pantoea agglomerans]|uniref:hypothetical protein n=1 Tax=Enterobacter agglomerans TaxID=549 RepID=UPI0021D7AD41|nr:hypothetical protein [Pantoea agglomerans]
MKITETEMRGLITGKAMPADIFVGESLAAYLVRKFTNLHTERDALAAAHSQLRESMAAIHDTIKLDGVSTSLGSLLSASKRAYEDSMPTDAYLNSVRADAIANALDASSNHCDTDCVMDAYDCSYEIAEMRSAGAIALHDGLVAHAAQLRAGEPS